MKKLFLTFAYIIIALLGTGVQAQTDNRLFPYPVVPDDMSTLSERCNYLVYKFWDKCPIKQSFSSLERLNNAFGDWISFMPYGTPDTVHMAIDNYIAAVNKQTPENILQVAKMAERWLQADTSDYHSDELYIPFCRAVVNSKKAPKAVKARYEAQLKILENSGVGMTAPALQYVTPDGEKRSFGDIIASRIILFFNDPDCLDCNMAKARLSADYNLNKLINAGLVKVVSIYPGEATDEWKAEAAGYPENWEVGACDDADTYFNLADLPVLYYLDARHKIIAKDVPVDNMLLLVQQINQQMSN